MAIQFLCKGCGQPIEVDDDLAGRAVKCPYCQQTTEAPTASTWQPGATPPTASGPGLPPFGGEAPIPQARYGGAPAYGFPPPPPVAKPPIVGYVSLALSLVNVVILVATATGIRSLTEGLPYPPKTEEETKVFQEEFPKRIQTRPDMALGFLGSCCVLPLAAIICGIVSLSLGQVPKWPAIVGLVVVVVGLPSVGFLLSTILAAAYASGG